MPIGEGLYRSQDQIEEDAQTGPGWTIDQQKPGMWEGLGLSVPRGLGQGVANGIAALAHGLQYPGQESTTDAMLNGPMAASYAIAHPESPQQPLEPWMKGWQGEAERAEAGARRASQDLVPDPRTTGSAANVVQGFTRAVTEFGAGALAGGPIAGAGVVGTTEGYARYLDLKDQGVDDETARRSGILTGITNAAGAVLPMALPGKFLAGLSTPAALLTQAGTGAAINTSFGAVARAGDAEILRKAGYSEMADQMEPWDKMNLATDAISGLFFGATAGFHGLRADPSVRDAAKVVQNRQEVINRAPGVPVDMKSAAVHQESLRTALDQLSNDQPVHIDADSIAGATFARPEQDPEFSAKIIRQEFERANVLQDAKEFDDWLAGRLQEEKAPAEVPRGTEVGEPLTAESVQARLEEAQARLEATTERTPEEVEAEKERLKQPPELHAQRVERLGGEEQAESAVQQEAEAPNIERAAAQKDLEKVQADQVALATATDPAAAAIAARPNLEIVRPRTVPSPDATHDSILEYLAKHPQGISREEAKAQGIDPAAMKMAQATVKTWRAWRKTGMTFDEAAEHLNEAGYPVVNAEGRPDPNVLLDRLDMETRGHPQYSHFNERWLEERAAAHEEIEKEMAAANKGHEAAPEAVKLAELAQRAAFYDKDAVKDVMADDEHPDPQTALESIIEHGEETERIRAHEAGEGLPAALPGHQDPFDLSGYSERDLTERERAQGESDRGAAAARSESEQRAAADRERGQFELTGSERASDANPRQADIFSAAASLDQAREVEKQAAAEADIAFKAAADCGARHA